MLGPFLKRLREAASVNQVAMAALLGVKWQSSVSAIEIGAQRASANQLAVWLDACSATAADRLEALRLAGEPAPDLAAEQQSEAS